MKPFELTAVASILLVLLAAGPVRGSDEQAQEKPPPLKSSVSEHVEVQLVELKVTVSDRRGNPVSDIRPDEVTVREGGKPQRLAFFEPVAFREIVTGEEAPMEPAPVYDAQGGVTQGSVETVRPPKPVRRIIFVFDPRNSRMSARDDWKLAAQEWVREKKLPDDEVGVVVLRGLPEWIGPLTSDSDAVLNQLALLDLHTGVPNRNRRNEMSDLIEQLRSLCSDTSGVRNSSAAATDMAEVGCAYEVSRPILFEWSQQTLESTEVLRALSGQLAAIPGEKSVVLFSEGMIDDPGQVIVNAMLNVFTYSQVDISSMKSRLAGERNYELVELHRTASAANVVFFTLDSRHANEGSNFSNLERTSAMTTGMLGVNPWREMYDATRGTLSALAYATGGRPFYGPDDLPEKIDKAAGLFYGVYSLGYYRSDPDSARGKVAVKIDRKKLVLEYDKTPRRQAHQPRMAELNLVVGQPQPVAENLYSLPVSLLSPLAQLPLRATGKTRGCDVGVFFQALSPDGGVLVESFETVTVVLAEEQYREAQSQQWQHRLWLELPAGPFRLRARLSDDRQELLADRSIDLTVSAEGVSGGFGEAAR
jgi:VWFA-related protein